MAKYKRGQVVVEAVRFWGGEGEATEALREDGVDFSGGSAGLILHSPRMLVLRGDWLVRGAGGAWSRCLNVEFQRSFEPVSGVWVVGSPRRQDLK